MKTLSFALVGLLAASIFIPALTPNATAPAGSISVSGEAVVKVVPDEVVLSLGVETMHEELEAAKRENDQRVRKVIAAAKAFNIEDKYIQTDFINIQPIYEDYYHKVDEIIGYRVGKMIVITLRDIDKFDGLLTEVLDAGANYVHGIEFQTTELRKYRDQARALAIEAASEKAQALSQELDQDIGAPISIYENPSGWWSSYGSWWGSRWGGGISQNVIQNAGLEAFTTEGGIAPGQISVRASVSATFELK